MNITIPIRLVLTDAIFTRFYRPWTGYGYYDPWYYNPRYSLSYSYYDPFYWDYWDPWYGYSYYSPFDHYYGYGYGYPRHSIYAGFGGFAYLGSYGYYNHYSPYYLTNNVHYSGRSYGARG